MKQCFFTHTVIQKAFSALSINREPSNKHQNQQLQIPLFNTCTKLFTLSINRLTSRVLQKILYKLLKNITDKTRSMENKFLCTEADTSTQYKNKFTFSFPHFFLGCIITIIRNIVNNQKSTRQEKEFVWNNNSSVWNKR